MAGGAPRIQSVTSNHGYQLKLNYASATSRLLSSAQAINNAVDYCDPTADACTGLSQAWPTVTISHSNPDSWPNVVTVTNSLNESRRYSFTRDNWGNGTIYVLAGIKDPGRTTDNITFAGGNSGAANDVPLIITRDGVTHTYSWNWQPGYWPELVRTGPLGQVLATRRADEGERPDYIRDGLNRTTDFTYNSMARLTRVTEPEQNYVQYSYDARGNITQTRHVAKPGSGLADIVTSATYSPTCANPLTCNKPITTTDALLRVTNYEHDGNTGQVTSVTLPAATAEGVRPQTRYSYAPHQAYYKNGSGAVVASGESVSLPTGVSACQTAASCDGTADEVRATIGYGSQTPGVPNNLLPVSSTVAAGDGALAATTAISYNSLGSPLTVDGPVPGPADTTRYRYDAGQRTIGIIGPDPDGTGALKHIARRFEYNGAGQRTATEAGILDSQSDADWSNFVAVERAETIYDPNGRKTIDRHVAGGVTHALTQQSYDEAGRVQCNAQRMNPAAYASLPTSACTLGTQGSFGPDRITRNGYDQAGQLKSVERAYGVTTANGFPATLQQNHAAYEYTPNGRAMAVIDANGNRAELRYDGHDRQSCWIFPSKTTAGALGGDCSSGDFESYGYDENGNRTTVRKRDGSVLTFQYDRLNRMTAKIVPERAGLAAAHTRDVYYAYDLRGLQTKARFDGLDGEGVTTYYNTFGRPVTTLLIMGGFERYLWHYYDPAGNVAQLTHHDGTVFSYSYDTLGRMTTLLDRVQLAHIDDYVIRYFYNAQGGRYAAVRGADPAGFSTLNYYDPVQRPWITYNLLPVAGADMSVTLAYNPANQIVERTVSNDAYAAPPAYNVSRAYSVNGLNQYVQAGPASFQYDLNGNLISDGTTSYVYDVENRLVSASGAKTRARSTIRSAGWSRTSGGAAGTTRFQYDGDRLIAEYDGAGTLAKRYVHGPGTDEPVAVYEGAALGIAGRRYMLADERGSIAALVNADGSALRDQHATTTGASPAPPTPAGSAIPARRGSRSSACGITRRGSIRRRPGGSCRPIQSAMAGG